MKININPTANMATDGVGIPMKFSDCRASMLKLAKRSAENRVTKKQAKRPMSTQWEAPPSPQTLSPTTYTR
ncbi:MAG: hypothetical protein R2825_01485 [Saprospiraceae bacterium]